MVLVFVLIPDMGSPTKRGYFYSFVLFDHCDIIIDPQKKQNRKHVGCLFSMNSCMFFGSEILLQNDSNCDCVTKAVVAKSFREVCRFHKCVLRHCQLGSESVKIQYLFM